MVTYTIKAETGYFFMSPSGFVSYAEDFYDACCTHVPTRQFSPAEYYLACRSIELSLKAFLLLEGVSRNDLKKKSLGHDIKKILKKCKELGVHKYLTLTKSQENDINKLNAWYSRKGFEYFEIENLAANYKALPEIASVKGLAIHVIRSLKEPCRNAANHP